MDQYKIIVTVLVMFLFIMLLVETDDCEQVERIVEVPGKCEENDTTNYKIGMSELRAIDEQGFALAGAGLDACAAMLGAAANEDKAELERQMGIVSLLEPQMGTTEQKRIQILEKYGFTVEK